MRRLVASLLAFAFAMPAVAEAHKGKSTRSLNVEAGPRQLVVLTHLKVTGDDQRKALFVLADGNRDGRLSEAEKVTLQEHLVARALLGVQLWVGTSSVTLQDVQARLQVSLDGPVEVMVHGVTTFSPQQQEVRISTVAGTEALLVRSVPGVRRLISASRGQPSRRGLYEAEMGPRDELKLVFGRLP